MGLWKVERRFRRALVDLKGEIRVVPESGGKRALPCRIRNLSLRGALVSLDAALEPGESVDLQLEISGPPLTLSGKVVWVGEVPEAGRVFGLDLNPAPAPDAERFTEYLRTASEQRRAARLRAAGIRVRLLGFEGTEALDLSATGLLLGHTGPLRPGDLVPLVIEAAGSTLRVQARVIRSTVAGRQGRTLRFQSGCAFLPPIPGDLKRVLDALTREVATSVPAD